MTTHRRTSTVDVEDPQTSDPAPSAADSTMTGTDPGETAGKHPIAEAGQQAGESVGQIAMRATGIGFRQADQTRESAAQGLNQLAESFRRVSIDVDSDQPAIANITSTAAEQTERLAGYLRQTDARQMLSSLEDVARRQPLMFLGGAFLLGVAASRLLKAGTGEATGEREALGQQRMGTRYQSGYEPIGPGSATVAEGI